MPDPYEFILTEVRDRVGIVTLNRPDRLNALHPTLSRELREAVLAFEDDPEIGAIVLTGAGRGFCAGADVQGWGAEIDRGVAGERIAQAARERPGSGHESWTQLFMRVKPTVIAYNGPAIGAGLTLTLGADYKIASERARLSMRFAAMGITPELESSMLLPHLVGLQHALDLMIGGAIVDAQHALAIGLVAEVVPHEELLDRAVAKAAEYARLHPETTRAVKRLVYANLNEKDLGAITQRELVALAAAQKSASHKEAVQAFLHKREPDFYRAVAETGSGGS